MVDAGFVCDKAHLFGAVVKERFCITFLWWRKHNEQHLKHRA